MRKTAILLICLLTAFTLWGQVDRTELESVDYSGVEFRNYEGPHQKIDTIDQIRGIGQVMSNWDKDMTGRYFSKYKVLHLVDPENSDLLDSDIMILGDSAGVDHIMNLRRILAAYLESAYEYSSADAELLARFVTYYNAVFRGRNEYFEENYSSLVLSNLDLEKAGLSTRFEDWPGKTEMLIPLTGKEGGPALKTDALTDPEVIENLREEENMGIEERKEITELKEQEIQEAEQAIEEEEKVIDEREEAVEKVVEQIEKREEEITKAEEEGEITSDEAEDAREELQEEKAEVAEEKTLIEEAREEVEERAEEQTERLEQIREEREEIAEDERSLQGESSNETVVEPDGIPFLTFRKDGNDRLGRLILVDTSTGQTLSKSTLDNVRTPGFTPISGGYVVIAGEDSGNRIISLVMLDEEDLRVTKSSDQRVSSESGIFTEGSDLYAVVEVDNKWVPGKFDKDLNFKGFLDIEVAEYTFFSFDEDTLIYQNKWGSVGTASLGDFVSP